MSNALPWRWVGVLHEYLTIDAPQPIEPLNGPWVEARREGERSSDPDTFRKDAVMLKAALKHEPDNTRYAFYLAQSWRDAGEFAKARQAYLKRAQMGGWADQLSPGSGKSAFASSPCDHLITPTRHGARDAA